MSSYVAFTLPLLLIFWNLGGGSIDLWDEALTAGRSLSLLRDSDIFNMKVNGALSIRKPPLIYWLNASAFRLFGVNEFALRLPNALFGYGACVLVALMAQRLYGRLSMTLALLLLCGAPLFFRYSREALTDTVFMFGMTLALAALTRDLKQGGAERTDRWWFAFGIMLALLGKGLMALILPLFALPALTILRRDRSALNYLVPTMVALIPLTVWIAVEWQQHANFGRDFFLQEALSRMNYQSNFLPHHIEPLDWYFSRLWKGLGPIGLLSLPMALWLLCRSQLAAAEYSVGTRQATVFLAAFALFYFVILSCASHKRDAYLLPLLPPLTLVVVAATMMGRQILRRRYAQVSREWILVIVVALGLMHTARNWQSTPDYRPEEKALAKSLMTNLGAEEMVATDDEELALLLHFYLERPIGLVSTTSSGQKFLRVSRSSFPRSRQVGAFYVSETD